LVKLLDFLSKFRDITIVCHRNADPDTLGCAYALRSALIDAQHEGEITILASEGVAGASSKLVNYLKVPLANSPPKKTDVFTLVDLPSLEQVPAVKALIEKKKIPYAIIDHHAADDHTLAGASLAIVKARSSASEIVFEALGMKIKEKKALEALLAGIIYDSRRFLLLPETAINAASRMIKMGAEYQPVLELLFNDPDQSEKIAKLKGAMRMILKKGGDWLIAFSYIGSFEASVAKALTDLGADVAFVINDEGDSVRLTGRSTDKFYKATSLNLAKDIMQPLANSFAGQGGGHPTAASVNIVATLDEAFTMVSELVAQKLGINRNDIKEIHT
jgi:phosphoesterase RecJ-like protein